MNLTEKIIDTHLLYGEKKAGSDIGLRVDQTITQDALGMIAYLAFEATGKPRVQTELSVSYLDHNMLYTDHRNPDDHVYLHSVAKKYGIHLSRAGNGICHAVHLARFSKPGKIIVGTDSHTPSAGAVGMLGIGAGGIEVTSVMAGEALSIKMPKVIQVVLNGELKPGVNAKDAALYLVGKLTVKGGSGIVLEYSGEGLANLSVTERMTLANMGAEIGATSSIFPSDFQTLKYFRAQGREKDFMFFNADEDATYTDTIECNLSELVPLVALPHQPDRVISVTEAKNIAVDQVFIGSCTNSSYTDLMRAAEILKGHTIAEGVSLIVSPSTRQNYLLLLKSGAIDIFVQSGARILECACGPCVGIGQAVRSGGISLRTSNRNFKGRCGTLDSSVYLVSPETAAASAVSGYLIAPSEFCEVEKLSLIEEPDFYHPDDSMIITPPLDGSGIEIIYGPNIKPIPVSDSIQDTLEAAVVIKLGDNVSTDEIAPSNPEYVASRSNIPEVSKSTFCRIDPGFWKRALSYGTSLIVAGENYGQGSSREHAALMPMYLGVRAVIAVGFARIHRSNLINFGILPLTFQNPEDLVGISQGDVLKLTDILSHLDKDHLLIINMTTGKKFNVAINITQHESNILRAGGLLSYIKSIS